MDPVKELMHRHRELCARAVDPLEIAAGLETHGITDRTAARFRHRDVFSLAEELYARVPRDEARERAPAGRAEGGTGRPGARVLRCALYLLPGAGGVLAVAAVRAAEGAGPGLRLGSGAAGVAMVVAGLWLCLRGGGPLAGAPRAAGGAPRALSRLGLLLTCWLTGYALAGDRLLAEVIGGGPDDPVAVLPRGPAVATAALVLCCALGPAAWCARRFAVRLRRGLATSRGLEDFAAAVRPLLSRAVALFLVLLAVSLLVAGAVLGALGTRPVAAAPFGAPAGAFADTAGSYGVGLPGAPPGAAYALGPLAAASALGVLLLIARLMTVHGRPGPAAWGLGAACAVEAAALGAVLTARLPGLGAAGRPVETAVAAYGPAVVPFTACTATALALLAYAVAAPPRASAHGCTACGDTGASARAGTPRGGTRAPSGAPEA